GQLVRRLVQVRGRDRPPLVQPALADFIGHRIGHSHVPDDRACVGEQRVGSVKHPKLSLFKSHDVSGEDRARVLPAWSSDRKTAAQSPFGEWFGGDRTSVVATGVAQYREFVGFGGRRRDSVDHRGDDADRFVDPGGQPVVDQFGQLAENPAGQRAVGEQVVARDDGQRAGVGLAPGSQADDELRRRGPNGRRQVVPQRGEVGRDLWTRYVEYPAGGYGGPSLRVNAAGLAGVIAGLGDRQRYRREF